MKRNDKCPCNSGKKFKKCHMNTEYGKVLTELHLYGEGYQEFILNKIKETAWDQTKQINKKDVD